VVVVDVVLTTVDVVVVVVDVVVVFVVVALVVVEEPQDARSSDATRRRLTVIQITPFFI
jgi:hypothetical protein